LDDGSQIVRLLLLFFFGSQFGSLVATLATRFVDKGSVGPLQNSVPTKELCGRSQCLWSVTGRLTMNPDVWRYSGEWFTESICLMLVDDRYRDNLQQYGRKSNENFKKYYDAAHFMPSDEIEIEP
jgi:hypothetical protein